MLKKSNYKILDLVGRGQFGRVYAAIELQSGTLVALKELNSKQLSTSSFLRELTFLVTLDHFNIVTCKALELQQNKRYLVMDYCEGGTLRNLIDDASKISLSQSLQLIIDVLKGLEFAHARGIIHRDLKPENILLKSCDRGYSAHISDFGIAKLNQEAESDVLGNTGSPAYMAPEQFYGDYSYSSDLYGLGIVLYELVVGDRPFEGMPKDLLVAHLSKPITIPLNIPLILRSIIVKALRKFPQYRFQSAAEMRSSLELAREIIDSDATFAFKAVEPNFKAIAADAQSNFDTRILHLAIFSERVYIGTSHDLIIRCDRASPSGRLESKTTFNEPIRSLQPNNSGCLVATTASLYYQSQATDVDSFVPVATFPTDRLATTVDPQGSWLAVSYLPQEAEARFKIYQLPNGKLIQSPTNGTIYNRLIALSSRHAIGLAVQERHTKFQLFNRRGNWLANFSVRIRLDVVIYNPLFPNLLLATEVDTPHIVILIGLKKFNLKRIQLEINPALIETCPLGYLLSDRQGNIIVLTPDGESVCKFQTPLCSEFEITAIAASPSKLLVASASSTQSQLQTFSQSKIIS